MSDFMPIRALTGELIFSHKKGPFGLTLSTLELVVHKPHANYYVALADIVSLVPCDSVRLDRTKLVSGCRTEQLAGGAVPAGSSYYALYASRAKLHNRSGYRMMGPIEFRLPIHRTMLEGIYRFGGLTEI